MIKEVFAGLSSNATTVWEKQQRGESCFLGRNFEIVTNSSEKASLADLLSEIQSTYWNLKDNSEAIKRLGCTISLIYKDDPMRAFFIQYYMKAVKNPKFSKDYTEELHKSLSILYTMKQFYKTLKEEVLVKMRQASLDTIKEEICFVLEERVGDKKNNSISYLALPILKTKEGTAFLFSILPTFWNLSSKELPPVKKRNLDEAYLEKALNSSHEEVRKIALIFLGHLERLENNELALLKTNSLSEAYAMIKTSPSLCGEKITLSLFPSLLKLCNHFEALYQSCVESKEQGKEISEEYEENEYPFRLKLLEEFELRITNVDGLYHFLSVEFNRMRQQARSRLAFLKQYGNSKYSMINQPPQKLPTYDDYKALVPIMYNIELEYFKRKDVVENYKPKEEETLESVDTKKYEEKFSKCSPKKTLDFKPKEKKEKDSEEKHNKAKLEAANLKRDEGIWKKTLGFEQTPRLDPNYPDHVTRWFEQPNQTVCSDSRYQALSSLVQKKVILFHAFSLQVDFFVGSSYSIESTYENPRTGQRDKLYSVPAEIFWNCETLRGYLQYAIDSKTKRCYHRCFSEKGDRFTDTILSRQVWDEADYPSLAQSQAKSQGFKKIVIAESGRVTFDPVFKSVHIQEVDYSITLYRIGRD